ncbi:MAG: Crp/Fnr family transcriptional regulator [Deltaproteobacteria bacterium]|jgi:CRP/FNR family transcriptional regulator, dissimilatory nitrate respiration regulator
MKETLDIISGAILFNGLPSDQIRQVADIAVRRSFGKGALIFSEGDDGNGFFLVVEGLVKIFKMSPDGKEQILHIFGPGEPFGEVPVFSGKAFPANAEAIQASRLLFFPREDFVNLVQRTPSLALNMLAVLSMRLRQFTVQVENLSLKEVPARLAAYLVYLSDEQQSKSAVDLEISKGQLASLLGTIPETLSRIFQKMNTQNLIEVEGRRIKLLDYPRLRDLSLGET